MRLRPVVPVPAEERIQYRTSDGFVLTGLVASPPRPSGWVVLMHGITESKDEYGRFYVDLAGALNAAGRATLRFDFRGHGESSGSSMDVSVVGDTLDVEATVRQLPKGAKGRLDFVATSFGAGPALLATASPGIAPRSITLIAPVLDYRRTFLEPETPWGKEWFSARALSRLSTRGRLRLEKFDLSPRLIEEFRLIRPVDFLARVGVPTLIIHGDRDSVVPYAVSQEVASTMPNIRLHTLRDADHGYPHYQDETGKDARSCALRGELVREAVEFVTSKSR